MKLENRLPILAGSAFTIAACLTGGFLAGRHSATTSKEEAPQASLPAQRTRPGAGNDRRETDRRHLLGRRTPSALDRFASLSPEELLAEAKSMDRSALGSSHGDEAEFEKSLLLRAWGARDPLAAMEFVEAYDMGQREAALQSILRGWAGADPAAAAAQVRKMMEEPGKFGEINPDCAAVVGKIWAEQDADASFDWAMGLKDRSEAVGQVLGQIAQTDPAKAISMLADTQGDVDSLGYRTIGGSYAAIDFDAAKDWAATLPKRKHDIVMGSALGVLSNTDPFRAAADMDALNLEDTAYKNALVMGISEDMARENPAAAAEFIRSRSPELFGEALPELIAVWKTKDPEAALAFARSLESEELRNRAMYQLQR